MLEKQNAEQGLMPLVIDEENAYGYAAENRYFGAVGGHHRIRKISINGRKRC